MDDNVLPLDRVVINRIATTQDHPDDIQLDLGEADTGRSQLTGLGSFTGIYGATSVPGIALHVAFARAGDALTAVAAGKGLAGLAVTGEQAAITADLTQPFAKIKVAAAIRGLDVRYGDDRAQDLGLDLAFDGGAGRVDVTHFGLGAPGGGKLSLEAHLDVDTPVPRRGPRPHRVSHRELSAARAAAARRRASRREDRGARRARQEVGASQEDRSQVQAGRRSRPAARGARARRRRAGGRPGEDRRSDGLRRRRRRHRARRGRSRPPAPRPGAGRGGLRSRTALRRARPAAARQGRARRPPGRRQLRRSARSGEATVHGLGLWKAHRCASSASASASNTAWRASIGSPGRRSGGSSTRTARCASGRSAPASRSSRRWSI